MESEIYILEKHFQGIPKPDDLKLVKEQLPPIKENEFLAEAIFLSVDPYMRAYEPSLPLGEPFLGRQVAKIIKSKAKEYPVGAYVLANFPWQTRTIYNTVTPKQGLQVFPPIVLPDMGDLSPSLALGVLGMPGHTAYFGFLEICEPREGDIVVVSGAAGAVGSHVGQIAKIKGCTVIGIAGDERKGKWLIEELGFDYFINYKQDDISQKLKEYAENGVDCYFDNVGGEISSTVLSHMKVFGRISVCGSITTYNDDTNNMSKATAIQRYMVGKQLKMEGFVVHRWAKRIDESFQANLNWIKEGKLKYRETITEGFHNTFDAFVDMLQDCVILCHKRIKNYFSVNISVLLNLNVITRKITSI